jgi:predicted metal-binding protein
MPGGMPWLAGNRSGRASRCVAASRNIRALRCAAPFGGVVSELQRPRLIVCTTCRAGRTLAEGETPLGAKLYAAVQALLAHPAAIDLREVACLANCERGCSAAIAMSGKWTYLLGWLDPTMAGDLLIYAGIYAASSNGTVMPSRRPASLRDVIMGRVPDLESRA